MKIYLFAIILILVSSVYQSPTNTHNEISNQENIEDLLLIKLMLEYLKLSSKLKEKQIAHKKSDLLASLKFFKIIYK